MTPFNSKKYINKKNFSKFTNSQPSKLIIKNKSNTKKNTQQNLTINLTLDEPRLVILSSKHINKPTKFFNNLAWKNIAKNHNHNHHNKNDFKLNNVKLTNAPANTTQYLIKDIETRDQSLDTSLSQTTIASCLQNTHDFEHDWNLALQLQVS
jgi:hypothetical protein